MQTKPISSDNSVEIEQIVTLTDRRRLSVSGITEVIRFDDTVAVFDTVRGRLSVKGENLRVETLDVDAGNVILNGTVSVLGYAGNTAEKSGVFGKLFQ